jgi:DNA-binding response OmpR family regulator
VVIADDNLNMMAMVWGILKAFGVLNIRSFPDGQTAYNALENTEVDFVVIDCMMEPLNGIEFTKKVRLGADSPNPFLPIIMLTGYTDRLRVFRARDAGVTEFMAKPISPKSLYARITTVIDRPRPFVRSENYFGPDRRRRVIEFQGADRRSTEAKIIDGDVAYAGPGVDDPSEEPAASAESDSSTSSNTDVETSNGQ